MMTLHPHRFGLGFCTGITGIGVALYCFSQYAPYVLSPLIHGHTIPEDSAITPIFLHPSFAYYRGFAPAYRPILLYGHNDSLVCHAYAYIQLWDLRLYLAKNRFVTASICCVVWYGLTISPYNLNVKQIDICMGGTKNLANPLFMRVCRNVVIMYTD